MKCPNCGGRSEFGLFCSTCHWQPSPRVLAIRGFRGIVLGAFSSFVLFWAAILNLQSHFSLAGLLALIMGVISLLFIAGGISLLLDARRDVMKTRQSRNDPWNWGRFLAVMLGVILITTVAFGMVLNWNALGVIMGLCLGTVVALHVLEKLEIRKKSGKGLSSSQFPAD